MFSFERLFSEQENNVVEHNGFSYHRFFPVHVSRSITMKFSFVSSQSQFDQAILILFPRNFTGTVLVDNHKTLVRSGAFRKLNFWKSTAPAEFEVIINDFEGEILICNGSDPIGTKHFCKHLSDGCAMYIEEQINDRFRMYCNDHELDDDCNDLIFDLEFKQK